jgi:hypothetical protein
MMGELFGDDDTLLERLIGYGIAAVIAAVLLLAPLGALAQTAPPPTCLPSNAILNGTGTDYKVFETAAVHGEVGWCPSADGTTWYIAAHRWCLKTVCDKAPPNAFTLFLGAIDRIRVAANPITQLQTEWATAAVPLATDLEKWQVRDWRYQACQWLTSTQPGVTPRPPVPIALPKKLPTDVDAVIPLTYCDSLAPGAKPLAPCAAQPVTWAQGAASCAANYAGGASGSSAALSNINPTNTGSATATCTDGAIAVTAPLCAAIPPPATVYVVTPNGTNPERQWFLAVQGPDGMWKRSTSPGGTTPVGGACDCAAISFKEFNITTYCKAPVANAVNPVVACMVKK